MYCRPMPVQQQDMDSPSPDATHAIAGALARHLLPGDTVLLNGEVGAGKTHFARGIIFALLDTPEDVPSPTYTLVQTYDTGRGEVWHADLYRLTDISELEELGLSAAFPQAICLVEWPDRLGPARPGGALSITFERLKQEGRRRLSLSWTDPKWQARLKGITDG